MANNSDVTYQLRATTLFKHVGYNHCLCCFFIHVFNSENSVLLLGSTFMVNEIKHFRKLVLIDTLLFV